LAKPKAIDLKLRNIVRCFFVVLFLSFAFVANAQFTPASRELSYHFSLMGMNTSRFGANVGLEFGIVDKLALKTKIKPGKGGQNYIKVNQLVSAINVGFVYSPSISYSALGSLTLEYRRTTKRKKQFQLGVGPGYMRRFFPEISTTDTNGITTTSQQSNVGYIAPTAFIGFGAFRMNPHRWQWWHVRFTNAFLIKSSSNIVPYPMVEIRLGFHKKPILK
jgi:hypothetical protein